MTVTQVSGSRSVSCSHMGGVRSGQSAEKAGQCEGRRLRDCPIPVPSWAGPASSLSLFTSAGDCESAHWTLVLHIPVNVFTKRQYKTNAGSSLTVPRVRCKQLSKATMEPAVEKARDACGLHVESLTRNESTCACSARSYWAITSMRERKSKGCASVPKLFLFLKWIYKVAVNF